MANKFTIEITGEGIVKFFIPNNKIVRIEGVIYAPKYDFNLIFLG